MANLYYKEGSNWLPLGGGSLPIGTYVYSDNNVSPAAEMGGTWQSLGYTAVNPVFYSVQSESQAEYSVIMRIFNTVIAFGACNRVGVLNLNFSALPAKSKYFSQGFDPMDSVGAPKTDIDGNASYRINSGHGLVAMYETTSALPTSISGGKYLFKRTA